MEKVELILIDICELKEEDISSIPLLTHEDLNEVNKIKIVESKIQKAVSFYLKRKYIGEYSLNENNKPISKKTYFNISHSKEYVALAIASKPVGVDVEQIRPYRKELIDFFSNESINDEESFFRVWTMKEAILKANGVGLNGNIKSISSFPTEGIKEYLDKKYFVKQSKISNYIFSIALESSEDFEILCKLGEIS